MLVLPRTTRPGLLQPGDQGGVVRRHPALEDARADRGGQPPGGDDVLDRDRDAGQRADPLPGGDPLVDRAGALDRLLPGDVQERVHARVDGAVDRSDPVEVGGGDLLAGGLPRGDRLAQLGGRAPGPVRLTAPPPGSAGRGTGPARTAGAPDRAASAPSEGRTSSSRKTLVSGSGCDVAGTSSPAACSTRATASRIWSSCPARRSSSACVRSIRASRARCATWSVERADMAASLVRAVEPVRPA